MLPLVLASSSSFRQSLLNKLDIPFIAESPDIDETALPDETAQELVLRLAIAKAKALAEKYSNHLIIGSDQVAVCQHKILGKPHNFDNAFKQLKNSSGQQVNFYTGLCLYNSQSGQSHSLVEPFKVYFRTINDRQISNYLNKEEPYQCAGSFKSEGLGIVLFEKLEGRDPNTLIGLPLIGLIDLLEKEGLSIL